MSASSSDAATQTSRKNCCDKVCGWLRPRHKAEDGWTEMAGVGSTDPTQMSRGSWNGRWSSMASGCPGGEGLGEDVKKQKSGREGAPPCGGRRTISSAFAPDDLPTLGSFLDAFFEVASSDSDEAEAEAEPVPYLCPRRFAVSAEAHGNFNQRHAKFTAPYFKKSAQTGERIFRALKECPFISLLDRQALETVVDALPVRVLEPSVCIMRQGDAGDAAFILLEGETDVFNEAEADDPADVAANPDWIGRGRFVRTMPSGRLFGEMSMLWSTPRTRSVYTRGSCMVANLTRETFHSLVVRHNEKERENRENCLRQVAMLETLDEEQIAQIGDALVRREFKKGEVIIRQGDWGNEFFIIDSGEATVEVETGYFKSMGKDVQEHAVLGPSSLFGERALQERTTRAATIRTRSAHLALFCLGRRSFERMLGPLSHLQRQNFNRDPRKSLADFYRPGNSAGPRSSLTNPDTAAACSSGKSDWFAVYRPTSRDAIAKMIGGSAVGKGLNVKGKSSKKNRLSGYVPFLQISDNAHKLDIEESPPDSRFRLFFVHSSCRQSALEVLEPLLASEDIEVTTERKIHLVDDYPGVFGIDLPETVLREAYIMKPDLEPFAGWETGRASEPAFMDMNFHAVRYRTDPLVCLYQWDVDNPMNPHGLLIAYAEEQVKPVVSDFDTFTVGSKGMIYEAIPDDQQKLAMWSLDHTTGILKNPGVSGWNSRWLDVLRKSSEEGFHPSVPKYGFGDAQSCRLIAKVVEWTKSTGAVRHGAESFNFYFPQELDEEYLIVWEKFPDKPWAYKTESQLKEFLLERCEEGYSFPLNPVWPVRDKGWYHIFASMELNDSARQAMECWYPPDSGISERIHAIHEEFPDGFAAIVVPGSPARDKSADLDMCERADLGLFKIGVKKIVGAWEESQIKMAAAKKQREYEVSLLMPGNKAMRPTVRPRIPSTVPLLDPQSLDSSSGTINSSFLRTSQTAFTGSLSKSGFGAPLSPRSAAANTSGADEGSAEHSESK